MSTSGVIILARSLEAQRAIQKLFADRKVQKKYIAVACEHLSEEQGSVDLPLMKDWPNRPKQKVDFEQGLPSLTHWRVLQRYQIGESFGSQQQGQQYKLPFEATRVELTPHTGRSHQLRVHLMSIGHPIVGDDLYATPEQIAAANRLLLHAEILRFIHPGTKQEVVIRAELPF
jgi:tRNA pseudouridine32 synthase / 23S rRNA pseudouridine746 synthase